MLDVFGMCLNISVANKWDKPPKYKVYKHFGIQLTIVLVVEGQGGREEWGK